MFILKKPLKVKSLVEVAKSKKIRVRLSDDLKEKIERSRKFLEDKVVQGEVVYGVNTGFGSLRNESISSEKVLELQKNLIRSHCVGVGAPASVEEVRATMLTRINSLAQGYSGVRLCLIEKLLELLNKNITPYVPKQGSVGCSGDLAPLSHISITLMGEGYCFDDDLKKRRPTKDVFREKDVESIEFKAKEGLSLNNGTAFMSGIAALNVYRAVNLNLMLDVSGALTFEALMGNPDALKGEIQKVRLHNGQGKTAKNFLNLLKGSSLVGKNNDVQDDYSLRCIPQVHGASKDVVNQCYKIVENEINSVTDNPLIFPDSGEVLSGGNFHGAPIGYWMDFLSIPMSDLGNISERRIYRLLSPHLNRGLNAYLIRSEDIGLNSGLMITQYTAASLAAENKIYSHPSSVDSIPTSAGSEDHVSFGTIAAQKCSKVLENIETITAIEIICAYQALILREEKNMGIGTQICFSMLRDSLRGFNKDKFLHDDIVKIKDIIKGGEILHKIKEEVRLVH
ncbi:MAG: histidine ammonia-lyase [bacterium]